MTSPTQVREDSIDFANKCLTEEPYLVQPEKWLINLCAVFLAEVEAHEELQAFVKEAIHKNITGEPDAGYLFLLMLKEASQRIKKNKIDLVSANDKIANLERLLK